MMLALLLAILLASAATAAEAQESGPVGIRAEVSVYDDERKALHLEDNVRITRGETSVHADEGFAYRGENGYERIELFGIPVRWRTVTEEGGEITGYADQVVYNLLDRTITLVGEAHLKEPRGTYSGERLVYNLDTQGVRGDGGVHLSIEPEVVDGEDAQSGEEGGQEPN